MVPCNKLYIDVDGLYSALQNECFVMLNDVADQIVKYFGQAIHEGGAGRHKWRDNAAKEFKVLSDKIAKDMIEVKVGLREGLEAEARSSFYAAQIMVALYGNHGPLYTKPGEMTFHDHMEDMRESEAKSVWALPSGFNWADPDAEHMLENGMKQVRTYFKNELRRILRSINFSDYVHVTGSG